MLDVITALAEVLVDARNRSGRTTTAVAEAAGVKERTVERWEAESSFPWKKDLPKAVAAYSEVTGVSERDLWAEAVARASRAVAELGKDAKAEGRPDAEFVEGLIAETAEAEDDQASGEAHGGQQ